jgi:hypothetical protein
MATKTPAAKPAPKAATKPAAKSSGKPTTALVAWKEKLAGYAKKDVKTEKLNTGAPTISTRGGILSIDGRPVPGGELNVVVIAAVHVNTYYPGRFDPDNKQAPVCYAYGDPEAEDPEATMAPHEEAEDPQSTGCADCEFNVMGSSDTGRGKACKNIRRLAVIDASDVDDGAEGVKNAEIRMLNVPVTSVRNWAKYTHMVADDLELPTFAVVTNVTCAPDAKTQYKVLFELGHALELDDAVFTALEARRTEALKTMTAPYPTNEELQKSRTAAKPMRPAGRLAERLASAKKTASKAAPAKAGRKF